MKVAVCCIGRKENLYIQEFVEHYKGLGVDKIFIYDNNYDGEEHFEDVIQSNIDEGLVSVVDFRNKSICQLEAYQNCYDTHKNEFDWFCFFDIDEYLILKNFSNIKDYLSDSRFLGFDMIHVNWKVYDDNNLIKYEAKPLKKRFKIPKLPLNFKFGYNFPENNHIKSIVRGKLNISWSSTPHTPIMNGNCCDASGVKCNASSPFCDYNYDDAWLNHYQTKTIEEWLNVKSKRGFPDGNKDFFKKNDAIREFFRRNARTKEKENHIKAMAIKDKLVILSMTTIPKRKERLTENLPALMGQSYKFDKLVINVDDNLAEEDCDFYERLKKIDERIEINKSESKWRSCNKLLPTIKKYPEDIVITLDDDIYYPVDTIKLLVEKYKENQDCIIAHEINPISFNEDMTYVKYENAYDVMLMQKEWGKYLSNCCLFPPHTFDGTDLYDYDKMMECTNGTHDELWFWVQSTLNGVQCIGLNYVRSFAPEMLRQYDKEEYCLTQYNNTVEKIKGYMDKINNLYGKRLIEQIKSKPVEFTITKDNIYSFFFLWGYIKYIYPYNLVVKSEGLTKDWTSKLINVVNHNGRAGI